jgi:hypothetical protein
METTLLKTLIAAATTIVALAVRAPNGDPQHLQN